jgi:hypothetical protein
MTLRPPPSGWSQELVLRYPHVCGETGDLNDFFALYIGPSPRVWGKEAFSDSFAFI